MISSKSVHLWFTILDFPKSLESRGQNIAITTCIIIFRLKLLKKSSLLTNENKGNDEEMIIKTILLVCKRWEFQVLS